MNVPFTVHNYMIPFSKFINPLALRAAKTGLTILLIFSSQKAFLSKISEGEMFIRILPTTLLQIFFENLLYFQVIFKSMNIADDTFLGNSECEWVKCMVSSEYPIIQLVEEGMNII